MGVTDGQNVSAAITNAAFLDATADDTGTGKYTFANTEAVSGDTVENVQREHNSAASFVGKALNSAKDDLPSWTQNEVGTSVDSIFARAEALTALFNGTIGHTHDGTDGEGPAIVAGAISAVPLRGYVQQGTIVSVTGSSADVSAALVSKIPNGSETTEGIVTDAPENKVVLRYASGAFEDDEILDALGNVVFGRLTYSATVWTLSFYSLVSGTETAYSFAAATSLKWYYQEIFNPLGGAAPVFSEFANIPSDNATAAIITATTSLQGKVSLSNATPSAIASSGSAGTASASVANADHTHAGVHSLSKSGSAQILGDVTLSATAGVTLTQAASDIQISAPALTSSTPSAVASSSSVGTSTESARADHAHSGAHSVALSGNPALTGDITVGVSGGTSGAQVGNTITLSSPALSSTAALSVGSSNAAGTGTATAREDHVHRGVSSVSKSGSSQLFGDVTLSAGSNVTLTQVGNDISISSSGGGGGGLSDNAPQAVGSTASAGVGTLASRDDHVHVGVHSLSKSGSAQIVGDATLTASNGISLTQASNNIDVSGAALLPLAGGTMIGNITYSTGAGALTSAGLVVGNFLNQRAFTSGSGTYTPTTGTRLIVVELIGGGGGGAGIDVTDATQIALGGGGGGGGYYRFLFRDVSGLTGTYSVAASVAGGAATGAAGTTGNTTSFTMDGYTLNALGGAGGTEGAQGVYTVVSSSAAGGLTSATGTVSAKYAMIMTRNGQASTEGIAAWTRNGDSSSANVIVLGSIGGSSGYGFHGNTLRVENAGGTDAGEGGPTYGAGGNGARVFKNTTGSAGGNGAGGLIVITEYA